MGELSIFYSLYFHATVISINSVDYGSLVFSNTHTIPFPLLLLLSHVLSFCRFPLPFVFLLHSHCACAVCQCLVFLHTHRRFLIHVLITCSAYLPCCAMFSICVRCLGFVCSCSPLSLSLPSMLGLPCYFSTCSHVPSQHHTLTHTTFPFTQCKTRTQMICLKNTHIQRQPCLFFVFVLQLQILDSYFA